MRMWDLIKAALNEDDWHEEMMMMMIVAIPLMMLMMIMMMMMIIKKMVLAVFIILGCCCCKKLVPTFMRLLLFAQGLSHLLAKFVSKLAGTQAVQSGQPVC